MHHQPEKQFESLIKEHQLLLLKVCRMYAYTSEDRQDLFQDIVLHSWNAFPRFRGEAKFSTWLYRVAINTAVTRIRKKQRSVYDKQEFEEGFEIIDNNTNQEEEERLQDLHAAISRLNQVEKAIVMLYMEERSYEEMEEILGMSQGSLRTKMSRIKEKLRQITKNI